MLSQTESEVVGGYDRRVAVAHPLLVDDGMGRRLGA